MNIINIFESLKQLFKNSYEKSSSFTALFTILVIKIIEKKKIKLFCILKNKMINTVICKMYKIKKIF